MSDQFDSAHMGDLSPKKKITMEGHDLVLMEDPAKSPYCCKGCKEKDVRPCYKHGSYHLHQECYDSSCKTHSIVFNLDGSNTSCKYAFHKEALVGKGVCEACGGDVKGWCFKCQHSDKPHYLHPCCAKLNDKLPIKYYLGTGEENIRIDLKANRPRSKCLLCGNKESSDGFSGWHYISHCRTYCYHLSCIKQLALKTWEEDDGDHDQPSRERSREKKPPPSSLASKSKTTEAVTVTIQHPKQKQDHDAGKRSEALPTKAKDQVKKPHQPTKKQPSTVEAVLGFTADVAAQLLNILLFYLGLPPLDLGFLRKLLFK